MVLKRPSIRHDEADVLCAEADAVFCVECSDAVCPVLKQMMEDLLAAGLNVDTADADG